MMKHAFAILLLVFAPSARASNSGPHTNPLAGTWTLVAADETRADGTRVQAYGANAHGLLIIDESGRYSLQIFRPERPKFAAGSKLKGTPQEYEAAVLGMSTHIGRCNLDPQSNTITFRIEHASYPNWDGTEQKRHYQLRDDVLTYEIPASATGDGTVPRSVWRRLR